MSIYDAIMLVSLCLAMLATLVAAWAYIFSEIEGPPSNSVKSSPSDDAVLDDVYKDLPSTLASDLARYSNFLA